MASKVLCLSNNHESHAGNDDAMASTYSCRSTCPMQRQSVVLTIFRRSSFLTVAHGRVWALKTEAHALYRHRRTFTGRQETHSSERRPGCLARLSDSKWRRQATSSEHRSSLWILSGKKRGLWKSSQQSFTAHLHENSATTCDRYAWEVNER